MHIVAKWGIGPRPPAEEVNTLTTNTRRMIWLTMLRIDHPNNNDITFVGQYVMLSSMAEDTFSAKI